MSKFHIAMLGICLYSAAAAGVPVRWTLEGVTFSDGGTAYGSFIHDADLDFNATQKPYSAIDVTTTAGSLIQTDAHLLYVAPGVFPTNAQVLISAGGTPPLTGMRALVLFFPDRLPNTGGRRSVGGREGTCQDAACLSATPPTREITAGFISGAPVAPDIPAFSPWALLATTLLLVSAGLSVLRKSAA